MDELSGLFGVDYGGVGVDELHGGQPTWSTVVSRYWGEMVEIKIGILTAELGKAVVEDEGVRAKQLKEYIDMLKELMVMEEVIGDEGSTDALPERE
jgi:hypothetical protein